MKKKFHFLCSVMFACILLLLFTIPSEAAPIRTFPGVDYDAEGCYPLLIDGYFIADASAEQILAYINEIRLEACTEGDVPDPRNTARNLTPDDYVPLQWSTALEEITSIRAAEASIWNAHQRPSLGMAFDLYPIDEVANGLCCTQAECLAWNYEGTIRGIQQFYAEKNLYVQIREDNRDTGHYASLINPEYNVTAVSCFQKVTGGYYTIAQEFMTAAREINHTPLRLNGLYSQMIPFNTRMIYNAEIVLNNELVVGTRTEADLKVWVASSDHSRSLYLSVYPPALRYSSGNSSILTNTNASLFGAACGTTSFTARISPLTAPPQRTDIGWLYLWQVNTSEDANTLDFSEDITVQHSWDSGIETTAATCESNGTILFHCFHCSASREESLPALGHIGGTATCNSPAICSRCNHAYGSVNPQNHTGGTATCITPAICSRCNHAYGSVNPQNHTGNTGQRYATAPSCRGSGYTGDVYCLDCDAFLEYGTRIPQLTHIVSEEPIILSEPTYLTEGRKEYRCTLCNTLLNSISSGPWGQIDLSSNYCTVKLSTSAYVYDGKVKKPSVIVKRGSVKVPASEYTVKYDSGRKNPGTYSVTVTAKSGDISICGERRLSFKISPAPTAFTKITGKTKALALKWAKKSQISGYQIQIATDSQFTSNKKTVSVTSAKTLSKTLKNLKARTAYYVRIRTYKTVSGIKYYSSWSKGKKVTTK